MTSRTRSSFTCSAASPFVPHAAEDGVWRMYKATAYEVSELRRASDILRMRRIVDENWTDTGNPL
jgi:hypothetical protein